MELWVDQQTFPFGRLVLVHVRRRPTKIQRNPEAKLRKSWMLRGQSEDI